MPVPEAESPADEGEYAALILNRTPFHVEAEVDGDEDFDT